MKTSTNDLITEWIKTHGNVSVADVLKRLKLFYAADDCDETKCGAIFEGLVIGTKARF